VDVKPGDGKRAMAEMREAGAPWSPSTPSDAGRDADPLPGRRGLQRFWDKDAQALAEGVRRVGRVE
jgi:hypothetical protein